MTRWANQRQRFALREETMLTSIFSLLSVMLPLLIQQPAPAQATLDFEFFKTRVQPILMAKREGNARCVSCHSTGTPMRLQPFATGSATWTEEESRKNFDVIRQEWFREIR